MLGGFIGELLRVDLTTGSCTEEAIAEDVFRKFLGCYGLGLWYLYRECPPGIAPFDPENPLIFTSGPLTGTGIPGANNLTCTTLNFNTGFTVGRSHTHGNFAVRLKAAGYDGIIVQGQSERPVYLWVHEGAAEIRDAGMIWGRDTHETEDLVRGEIGEARASVAAIGPAGENLCRGALIANDRNHSLSYAGAGAVMGSKGLKAIAVYGSSPVPVFRPKKERDIAKLWRESLDYAPDACCHTLGPKAKQLRHEYERRTVARFGGLSSMNFQRSSLPGFLADCQQRIISKGCPGCSVSCCYDVEIVSDPHKGYVATLAGGSEALESIGSLLGIKESGSVFYLADLLDRLGLEGNITGSTIAMALEAYERGLVSQQDTDGLKLRWGDASVVEKLIRKCAYRKGFGRILALGPKAAAEAIGGEAPSFALHVKGSGINMHDWRHNWGVLFGQIISSGVSWAAPGVDGVWPEPAVGLAQKQAPLIHRGKAEAARATAILKNVNDSTGVCWFNAWGVPDILSLIASALCAVTGWEYNAKELLALGERIAHLERAFNIRHGLTPEDDSLVSPRLVEPPGDGPGQAKSIGPYLRGMIKEYYRLMGWDEKSGRPWRNTLTKSGLGDVAKDLW